MSNKSIATIEPVEASVTFRSTGLTATDLRNPLDADTFQQAVATIQESGHVLQGVTEGVMAEASLLLVNGTDVSGLVGKAEDGKPFQSQSDLAVSLGMGTVKDDGTVTVAKSHVLHQIRLGRARIWYGVRPGSADWTLLNHKTYGVQGKEIAPFVKSARTEMPTKDERTSFRAALVEARNRREADRTKAVETKAADKRAPGGETKQVEPEPETREVEPTAGDALVLLRTIEEILNTLTEEQAHPVREEMRRIVRNNQRKNALLAEKAEAEEAETVEGTVVEG